MSMSYRTILIDPPWELEMITGFTKPRNKRAMVLPYPTLTIEQIKKLPIPELSEVGSHLWLWCVNRTLHDAIHIMDHWGFKYMTTVTWVKPSGFGAWWINRTQTCLFGYYKKCEFKNKFQPNVLFAPSRKHSQKPECSYELIEQVSFAPRVELFARSPRAGWDVWGNEVVCDLDLGFPEG